MRSRASGWARRCIRAPPPSCLPAPTTAPSGASWQRSSLDRRSRPEPVATHELDSHPGGIRPMTIGIIGLGYVGLPLAVAFAEAGHDVIGYDTNASRTEALRQGRSHVEDIPSDRLARVLDRVE